MTHSKTDKPSFIWPKAKPAKNIPQANNALHGITLKMMLNRLLAHYGWKRLAKKIPINCFTTAPTINSSLKLLRRTPWAREKVEILYLQTRFRKPFPEDAPKTVKN